MFQGLQEDQLQSAVEALLFVSDEPVSVSALARVLEVSQDDIQHALWEIQERLEDARSGIQLLQVAGNWRLCTHPAFHELLEQYVASWDTRRLSNAALEVLAIVAYLQPITRTQLSNIRGVTSDGPLNTLIERGYVRESGVLDAPGNPVLFATTQTFLEKYGLTSIDDLSPLEEFAPDEAAAQTIRERLDAPLVVAQSNLLEHTDNQAAAQPQGALGEQVSVENDDEWAADAAASLFGVVEKIDFDKLTFNTDDE